MNAGVNPVEASVATVGRLALWWTRWLRSTVTLVFGMLAVLGLLLSTLTVWAGSVLFDTDTVAAAAGEALTDPASVTALASEITDQVFAALDVEARLGERLDELAGAIDGSSTIGAASVAELVADGAARAVETAVAAALSESVVRDALEEALRAAHGVLLAVLDGDEDSVSLDLVPVASLAISELQRFGLFVDVDLPERASAGDRVGDVAREVRLLSEALDLELPETFGSIVVYTDAAVERAAADVQWARDLVVAARRIGGAIFAITVVSALAMFACARRRGRATLLMAVGIAGTAGLARLLLARVVERVPDLVSNHTLRLVVRDFLGGLTSSLSTALALMVLASLFVAVGLFSAGRASARRR